MMATAVGGIQTSPLRFFLKSKLKDKANVPNIYQILNLKN
jgi:hypothetical protein